MRTRKHPIPDQKSVTYGVSAEMIALRCGVSYRTACRWKSGAVEMDTASKLILSGDLGCFAAEWSGWIIKDDSLISPEGWEITMSDILASKLHEAQLAAWRREVSMMKARVLELETRGYGEDQPTPDSWDVQIING